jgi:hypothetical protein
LLLAASTLFAENSCWSVTFGASNIDPAKHAWAILAKLEAADDSSSGQMLKTGTRATCGLDPLNGKSQLRFGEILLGFVENLLLGPRCRRHLLGARHRCDLLRGLTGLRLRRLSPCVVELPINVLAGFPELIHALPQAPRQVRQLFRPEQDEHNEEDDK